MPFVGREAHLAALAGALGRRGRSGRTVVVFVHGRSGVGKSALVQTFLDGPACRDRSVVLAGRCYERESVPYKALDSLIDALEPPPAAPAAARGRGVLAARTSPPWSGSSPSCGGSRRWPSAPRRAAAVPDPQELRRRAFVALRELLARLGDRRPLVLAIDDLQWGDTDSLAVLTEILRPPDPPVLLLVACYRSEEAAADPFLRDAFATPGAAGLDRRELAVGPLSPGEARALAQHLLGATGPDPAGRAEAVARESGGNPFFVAELARSVLAEGPDAGPGTAGGARPPSTRCSGRGSSACPTTPGGCWRSWPSRAGRCARPSPGSASAATATSGPSLALLRAGAARPRGRRGPSDDERVETYHDRVRETVVAHLTPGDLRTGTAASPWPWRPRGRPTTRRSAPTSGGRGTTTEPANTSHAPPPRRPRRWRSTARRRSTAWRSTCFRPAGANGGRLRAALAEALANAGRGAEAAREYLAACEGATVAEALELRRRAAMQFLISGHIDQGLDALRDVLAAIGMTLPRTPRRALASLLWRRALLRLRGLGFRPRDTSEVAAADLTRIDVCWSAGVGLSNVDWIRGADFQARGLLLALRAGEPYRVARALAVEAAQAATAGRPARRRTARLLDRAESLARGSGRPYALGMVALARGRIGLPRRPLARRPGGVRRRRGHLPRPLHRASPGSSTRPTPTPLGPVAPGPSGPSCPDASPC